jgi:ABC-2 type transport system permease protein
LVCTLGLQSITSNATLVRKVAFPRETLVLSQVIFSFVQFSIEMVIVCVALAVVGSALYLYIPIAFIVMITLGVFATGIALMLSVGAVYFRDLGYLWTIINQVWFYSTPVIYDPARFDGRVNNTVISILYWNPPAVYLRAIRFALYDGRFPGFADLFYCIVAAAVSLTLGMRVFRRFSRRIAEEL